MTVKSLDDPNYPAPLDADIRLAILGMIMQHNASWASTEAVIKAAEELYQWVKEGTK